MTHTPEPWHVDAYGCHNDYKLRLCEPMRSGFPLATIAQFQYNWRDAGQYDRQISYKEAEANTRRAAACVNALKGFSTKAIEAGVVQGLVSAAEKLSNAEHGYRLCHDMKGDGHTETGRAWDYMRKCGDELRTALSRLAEASNEPA